LNIDSADGLLGSGIVIRYDPAVIRATAVSKTPLSSSQSLTVNLLLGEIRISLFGAFPLQGGGALLNISFDSIGAAGSRTVLDLVSASLNEGEIPAVLLDGRYCVQGLASEVQGLRLSHAPESGPAGASLQWDLDPFAEAYRVYRGSRPDLGDLACLLPAVPAPPAVDGAGPALDGVLVYLVTAVNCRGESTLGTDSSNHPRVPAFPCP
jgi:hypothetical protein